MGGLRRGAEQGNGVLRVIHIITKLELGGAQRNTLYTVAHLDPSRFSVGLAWGPGGLLDKEAEALEGVALHQIPSLERPISPLRDLRALHEIRNAMRAFAPDIVHTHSSKAGILGRTAARLEGVQCVVHSVHGWGFTPLQSAMKRSLFVAVERRVAQWTDHFIAVSEANRKQGEELGIINEGRVSVIRSGIDLERLRMRGGTTEIRRLLDLPPEVPVVTQVGNFKPQKAPLDFVKMAAAVGARHPRARFVLAGDGVQMPAAAALASRLGIADRLRMPGWVDDVPALLGITDVAVLSSRHEGLPRAVVEALAAGVPVVATAVDGTPEVVRHGVNGYLVAPGDPEAMASRVSYLLKHPEQRRSMGQAALIGLDEFDIDLMVRRQEELYACLSCRSK